MRGIKNFGLGGGRGSAGGVVYSYADTGYPVAPGGGAQFAAIVGPNAREQHDIDFSAASRWAITFDVAVHSLGSSENPAGTFTMTSGATYDFRAKSAWDSGGGAWSLYYDAYDSAGNPLSAQDTNLPGFHGLSADTWYQEQVVFDVSTNRLVQVSIVNASGGTPAIFTSSQWYLAGGASGTFSATSILMYGGSGGEGRTAMIFDNIALDAAPEPAGWMLLLTGLGAVAALRRRQRY